MIERVWLLLPMLIFLNSCSTEPQESKNTAGAASAKHLINDVPLYDDEDNLQAIIEIPAGSIEKWEVNKQSGQLERDSINGIPRSINYLGYPANYGFIPQTLLSKDLGGDGDPLDAIVLGPQLAQGAICSCKVLGVLKLKDGGEQDDKLILAAKNSLFATYTTLDELDENHPRMLEAIASWFTHYKGRGIVFSEGYVTATHANAIIKEAHNQFIDNQSK